MRKDENSSAAKVIDIAHVTYQAPDLGLMEQFLTDFGLIRAGKTEDTLYMRGAGEQYYLHETKYAENVGFIGAAFEVESFEDLEKLELHEGSSCIEESSEPGGGHQVRMFMPDGFEIRAIYGREKAEVLKDRPASLFNSAEIKERVNHSISVKAGPCQALRLGHFVLHVTNHDESVKWLSERFALLPSDYLLPPGQEAPVVGSFLRFNRGAELVDHHSLLILESAHAGVHHCSFEVLDLDSIQTAHDYLVDKGWKLDFGVGRHLLGSQIFDYWKDPFGFRVEHYTDGDVCDDSYKPGTFNGTADQMTQWGMEPPRDFFE